MPCIDEAVTLYKLTYLVCDWLTEWEAGLSNVFDFFVSEGLL